MLGVVKGSPEDVVVLGGKRNDDVEDAAEKGSVEAFRVKMTAPSGEQPPEHGWLRPLQQSVDGDAVVSLRHFAFVAIVCSSYS